MYTIFPYNASHIKQYQADLNNFTNVEIQNAFKENLGVLKKIIGSTFDNLYLVNKLINFIDAVITDQSKLNNRPGDSILAELNNLYTTKASLNEEEKNILASIEAQDQTSSAGDCDTIPEPSIEEILVIDKVNEIKRAEALIQLDPQSQTLEKAMILNIFNDISRMQKLKVSTNIKRKDLITKNGSWAYVADSFVGKHTLGVNSDSYSINPKSKGLLGVLADGATLAYTRKDCEDQSEENLVNSYSQINKKTKREFTGHVTAQSLSQNIADFNFQHLGDIDLASPKEKCDKNTQSEKEYLLNRAYYQAENIEDAKGKGFKPVTNEGNIVEQYRQWLNKAEPDSNSVDALKDPELQLAITAMIPLYVAAQKSIQTLKDTYKGIKKDTNGASTVSYAFELGNKIIAVQVGDSDIAAYDKAGNKIKATKTFKPNFSKDGCDRKLFGIIMLYQKNSRELNAQSIAPWQYKISVYNRDDVHKLAMISDGASVFSTSKELPNSLTGSIEENLSLIATRIQKNNSKEDIDDKTAIFFERTS